MFAISRRQWTVSLLACAALCSLVLTSACKPAEEEEQKPEPTLQAEAPEVEEPEEDPLEEARTDAEAKAQSLIMPMVDQLQYLAADIEAAAAKAPAPVKRPKAAEPETGTIDQKKVAQVIRGYQGAMQHCYERALKREPGLSGRVTLSMVIGSNGKVSQAKAKSDTIRDRQFSDCVEGHARSMQFPKPVGGAVRVNFPFNFTPSF